MHAETRTVVRLHVPSYLFFKELVDSNNIVCIYIYISLLLRKCMVLQHHNNICYAFPVSEREREKSCVILKCSPFVPFASFRRKMHIVYLYRFSLTANYGTFIYIFIIHYNPDERYTLKNEFPNFLFFW